MTDPSAYAPSIITRFWAKTAIAADCLCRLCAVAGNPGAKCVTWTAAMTKCGYGRFTVEGRRVVPHRFAYEYLIGPIPAGLELDHLCKVRNCLNVTHLEPVTGRENLLRGDTVNARNAAKTHCIRGHEYTPENTLHARPSKRNPNGQRECRTCRRERDRAKRQRAKSSS